MVVKAAEMVVNWVVGVFCGWYVMLIVFYVDCMLGGDTSFVRF